MNEDKIYIICSRIRPQYGDDDEYVRNICWRGTPEEAQAVVTVLEQQVIVFQEWCVRLRLNNSRNEWADKMDAHRETTLDPYVDERSEYYIELA